MGCWCETNDKGKTKAIKDQKARIQQLIATSEENDMLQSIGSLGSAVKALSKHHGASFLQVAESSDSLGIIANVRAALHQHGDLLKETITPRQRRALEAWTGESLTEHHGRTLGAFLQESQGEGYNPEYQSQSGGIFGVLQQMKETFETNLAQSQQEETTNQQAYEGMKAAKTAEIAAGNDQVDTKTQEMAEAGEKKAQANQEQQQTEASLAADIKFLANLKEQCANVDQEFEERTKTRQLETQAVSKAMAFLTSDEAHDLVSRTLGLAQRSSFAQRLMQAQESKARLQA